jgi:hypothetical protein
MSTMNLLADELRHINAFLLAQVGVHPEGCGTLTNIFETQKTMVVAKVQSVAAMAAGGARELIQIITSGPWTPAQKSEIAAAVNSRLIESSAGDLAAGRRRVNQTVTAFHQYLSESDVVVLKSSCNDVMKVNVLVDKCMAMSLDIPSERTIQHMIGVFMAIAKPGISDPTQAFATTQEFKRLLKQRTKVSPCVNIDITVYPDDPSTLPDPLQKKIFGDSKPADPSSIPELSSIISAGRLVPCRRSSKLVRESPTAIVQQSSSSSSHMMQPDVSQQVMHAIASLFSSGMQQGRNKLPTIQIMSPANRTSLQLPPSPPLHQVPSEGDHLPHSTPSQPHAIMNAPLANASIPPATHQPLPTTTSVASHPSLLELPAVPVRSVAENVEVVTAALDNRKNSKGDTDSKKTATPKTKAKAKAKAKAKVKATSAVKPHVKKGNTKSSSSSSDKWAGLPNESKRSKMKPNGCPSCRWKVGCTPSCWRKKGY